MKRSPGLSRTSSSNWSSCSRYSGSSAAVPEPKRERRVPLRSSRAITGRVAGAGWASMRCMTLLAGTPAAVSARSLLGGLAPARSITCARCGVLPRRQLDSSALQAGSGVNSCAERGVALNNKPIR